MKFYIVGPSWDLVIVIAKDYLDAYDFAVKRYNGETFAIYQNGDIPCYDVEVLIESKQTQA